MKYCVVLLLFLTSSCNFSITMVHTQGQATDVVDEEAGAKADVSPDVNLAPGVL